MNLTKNVQRGIATQVSAGFIVVLSVCRLNGAFAQSPIELPAPVFTSAKQPGEVAVLDVKAPYCWATEYYRLEYTAHPSPRVTVWVSWYYDKDKRTKLQTGPLRRLGTVMLSSAQADRLDERLREARLLRTTEFREDDSATFTLLRNGKPYFTEPFKNFPANLSWWEDAYTEDLAIIPEMEKGGSQTHVLR
jgi:hypothetical protein